MQSQSRWPTPEDGQVKMSQPVREGEYTLLPFTGQEMKVKVSNWTLIAKKKSNVTPHHSIQKKKKKGLGFKYTVL